MKKLLILTLLSSLTMAFESGFTLNASLLSHTATEESKGSSSTTTYGSERSSSEWFPQLGFGIGAGYRFVFKNNIVFMPEVHYQSIGQDIISNGYKTSIDSNYGFSLALGYNLESFIPYIKLQKHNKVKFTHSNTAIPSGVAKDYESGESIGSGTDVVALGFGSDIKLNELISLRLEYMHTKPLEYKFSNGSSELEQRITQDSFGLGIVLDL